jgi:hypothetical protein
VRKRDLLQAAKLLLPLILLSCVWPSFVCSSCSGTFASIGPSALMSAGARVFVGSPFVDVMDCRPLATAYQDSMGTGLYCAPARSVCVPSSPSERSSFLRRCARFCSCSCSSLRLQRARQEWYRHMRNSPRREAYIARSHDSQVFAGCLAGTFGVSQYSACSLRAVVAMRASIWLGRKLARRNRRRAERSREPRQARWMILAVENEVPTAQRSDD